MRRERIATRAERIKDKDARIMVEWVTVYFSNKEPTFTINCDLCT